MGGCRARSNTALDQRLTWWRRGRSVSRVQQAADLKDLGTAFPEDAALHAPVVPEVLARLAQTYQAFFRRVSAGEKPGFPRSPGQDRSHSCPDKEEGTGARLDNGFLVLSTLGRRGVRWSRPMTGTIQTVPISRDDDQPGG